MSHQNVEDIYRLSPVQQGMLFHTLYEPGGVAYFEQFSYRLEGAFDPGAFVRAWRRMVDRHPVLRTAVVWEGLEEPVQVVHRKVELPVLERDLCGPGEATAERERAALQAFLEEDRRRGFDLSSPPLIRIAILGASEGRPWIVLSYHHLLLDGWSAALLMREAAAWLLAETQGREPEVPVRRPFRDYVAWLRRQDLGEAEAYWREALAGFDGPVPLALSEPRRDGGPEGRSHGQLWDRLDPAATTGLREHARARKVTLNALIQAAWAWTQARYSGAADALFGATVSGRPPALRGVESMIGCFINTLPVRVAVPSRGTVTDWVHRIQDNQVRLQRFEHSPLVKVREWAGIGGDRPLFDVILVFENYDADAGNRTGGVDRFQRTNYPLTVVVYPGPELELLFTYQDDRFESEELAGMLRLFREALEALAAGAERVEELPVAPAADRARTLTEWNDRGAAFPSEDRLEELFARHAALRPDAMAITADGGHLSYAEVDARAERLALRLVAAGVGPEVLVGLAVERSPEMAIGILAILRAGGAYLPLDPSYPEERLAFMMEDSGLSVLLAQEAVRERLPATAVPVVTFEAAGPAGPRAAEGALPAPGGSDPLAYVIYTSGSTGRPKGSLIPHRAVTRLLRATEGWYGFGPDDAWTLFHSYAFDFSVWELWGALAYGGRLVVVPYWVSRSPESFHELLRRERVTVLNQTPSAFQQLVAADGAAASEGRDLVLEWVIFGGEALAPSSLAPWFARHGDRRPRLVNMYGITETTVHVTYRPVAAADLPAGERSPVGVPIPDLLVYLLDRDLRPVPVGVPGEILVGGAGLARGYLGHPGLTAERFVPNPFAAADAPANAGGAPGGRLYRAGDLARRLPGGQLEFLGRIDHQVKIRGFRIELGEIQAVLARHPGVAQVAVLAREDTPGDRRLVAYVVPAGGAEAGAAELREHAARHLPEYMVPAAFVVLAELPLTVNGKLDRARLPAPEDGGRLVSGAAFEPPETPTEELLAGVWAEVLGVERVGRHDDFFDLGGHSLLATRVAARLRQVLGVSVPLRALFEEPRLRAAAALVDRLREAGRERPEPPIRPVPREGDPPLSFAQERLWFLDRMDPTSSAYNVPGALRLRGRLDAGALAASLALIVRRHESLRTAFSVRGGRPVQVVVPRLRIPLPVIDVSGLGPARRGAWLEVRARRESERRFDLATGPLLRTTLVRLGAEDHAVLVTFHHIVADAWSLGVFVRELAAAYTAEAEGRRPSLPALPVQYADYAIWQREWLRGEVLEEQLEFWRRHLAGAPPSLELPTDRPRPPVLTTRGAVASHRLPEELGRALRRLARRRGATLYMVLMAAFDALLSRYSGQGDLVVGSTIANRSREAVQGLIGFFVNALALRIDLSDDPPFADLVDRVRRATLDAYEHQDVPFEKLVEEVQARRDLSRAPVFQVVLQLQNLPPDRLELPGIALEPVAADTQTAKFDLVLNLAELAGSDGIQSSWRYRTDLFDRTTVCRMARHLEVLLTAATADPALSVSDLPLLTRAEAHALLAEAPAASAPAGHEPIHALFEAEALRRPAAVAAVADGASLTYGELDRRANRLARHLERLGVAAEVPVALCLERSLDLVTAILGVLKAGGAYVPLDPAYPAERLRFTLEDCSARAVITRESLLPSLPAVPEGTSVVCLDRDGGRIDSEDDGGRPAAATAGNLAYVIYTSGSTGRPKGVLVTHGNLTRLLSATDAWFGFGADDAWTLFHSYAFDFSVWELWGALAYGGRLVVIPYGVSRSPDGFHGLLGRERVTVLNQTPSAFRQLVRADAGALPLTALRSVVFGGEALDLPALSPWFARYGDRSPRMVNMYGITETTVHVTYRPVGLEDLAAGHGSVIGRPIPDLRVHLLDPRLRPVPDGVAGEIHVGGAGLARGYLGRPGLTAERFVPDPFADRTGGRLYKSGDLARRRPRADLEYLGRIDHQVKVRGFRIELGEIESALAAHPSVAEVVVLARGSSSAADGGARLVAYVVPAGPERPGPAPLRAHAATLLPEYMVPSAVVVLDALPLTENGKVDRAALPEPDAERPDLDQALVAPRDALEALVAGVWRECLGVETVGVEDDFFDLGGNSLIGAVLVNRLQELLGEIVHVVVVFDAPTVARMADYLRRQHPTAVGRLLGDLDDGADGEEPAAPVDESMVAEVHDLVRAMPRFTVPATESEPANPPAVFVLSAPRSGSTLLRVMMGGHPGLFAPPELELLSFATLADRREVFSGRDAFWLEGAIRAVMEIEGCGAEAARETISAWEDEGRSTRWLYGWLQERLGGRLLVDKTPSYALRQDVLQRAERGFREPRYVHLVRHPYGMIRSFEEAKLDQIFFRAEHRFTRRQLAELIWVLSERNIRAFLEGVPEHRCLRVRYEDLVRRPEPTLRSLCSFLGLAYEPAMAQPYRDLRGRMTDGIHAESRMLGDVKFHQHAGVDATVAERWRESYRRDFLGDPAWELARPLGYEPLERRLPPIDPAGSRPGDRLPLSFAQERLWFLDVLDPGTHTYNIPVAVRLVGGMDLAGLAGALRDVARRQASLRTTFTAEAGVAAQVIAAPGRTPLPVIDLSALPDRRREREAVAVATAEARRPFDLERGPLFRASLLRLAAEEHAVLLTMHHIVSDGWSMGLLVRETLELYAGRVEGRSPDLPSLPVQYADFAIWQRRFVSDEVLDQQVAWWRERLAGLPVLQLPTDRPRPGVQTFRGSTRGFRYPPELAAGLRRIGRETGATRYATLLAAFQAFLGRWAGQDDLAVGSPFANRGRQEVEGLIGFFVNTLVLRGDLHGDPQVSDLVARTREAVREAFAHQDVPFERVVQEVRPDRNLAVPPLFQVMLTHQEASPTDFPDPPGLRLEPLEAPTAISKFDLTLTAIETERGLAGQWVWNLDLFDAATVERIGRSFECFLQAFAERPDRRLSQLPLLSAEERRKILVEWNRSPIDYRVGSRVPTLVAAQAAATPDAVALVSEGARLSYAELVRRSGRLAGRLAAAGARPEAVVAVAGRRSADLVVGLLAVLETGAAYLPLDPDLPAERLGFMIADAGAALVLAEPAVTGGPLAAALATAGAAGGGAPPTVLLDGGRDAGEPAVRPAVPHDPEQAAYVIYTSGSTGRPKGVVVSHGAFANRLEYARAVDMQPDDAFLQKTTVSFDVSVLEIFAPLVSGGRVVLPPPGGEKDTGYLVDLIARERVTQTSFPPTLLYGLLEEEGFRHLSSLRTVVTGGETVPPELPERFYRALRAELLNRYGPTETTVSVTSWTCRPEAGEHSLPIGRPTAGARIHVLDRRLEPVPAGVVGEIVVGGPGVARGYRGRPGRTAESFVPDPFAELPGARAYRTGDLGRFRPDGAVEFAGRVDRQVKVRGFRVELGEIESILGAHPRVREAAVVDRGEGAAKSLAAYVVAEEGTTVDRDELVAWATDRLPAYMVPSHFVPLPKLPLTPTGKVDRAALPEPGDPTRTEGTDQPPEGPVEEIVATVWADVLARPVVGRMEGFFDLGGHSLLATRVVSRLRELFGVDLPLRRLFEEPTVAGLARVIEALAGAAAGLPEVPPPKPLPRPAGGSLELPLSFAQERLWFLERLIPGSAAFHMVSRLRLIGRLHVRALAGALARVQRRHETLRSAFGERDGSPVQRVARELPPPLAWVDLTRLPGPRRSLAMAELSRDHAVRPFDLERPPLARMALVRLEDREHHLLLTLHHAMADGWSVGILVREIATLYRAFLAGEEPSLDPLPIQYGDFAAWQREHLAGEVLDRQLSYWRGCLAGAPPFLNLPTDRPRRPVPAFRGSYERVRLPEPLVMGLRRLAAQAGATLFMVLLAALDALFGRLSGQTDVVIGTPVAGRSRIETEGLIGFFLNNLVLRTDLSDDPSFRALVARVRRTTLDAFAHQDLPFEKVVEACAPARDLSHAPLFQHALVFQNTPRESLELPGLVLERLESDTGTTRFDLSLSVGEVAGGLAGRMFFNRDLYERETVRRMLGRLETLVRSATEEPDRPVSALALMTPAEREELRAWNRTHVERPGQQRLEELILAQAGRSPDAVAVSAGSRSLTYAELERRSRALAGRLRSLGVGPETLVGVCAERSLELMVALVAILRSGGAYVPLDPSYPEERLAFMVEDSAAPVVLVQEELAERVPGSSQRHVVALEPGAPGRDGEAAVVAEGGSEALAYVIYTSGSTGRPKGAANAHRGIVNRLLWMQETYRLDGSDAVLQKTPFSFDVSVWELFWPLLTGARLVMAAPGGHKDPGYLAETIRRERVTTIHFVPSMLQVFLDSPGIEECRSLRWVIASGEALPFDLVERHHRRLAAPLHNLYGPTEAAVDVTWWPTRAGDARSLVPIGRPVANTRIHVVDPRMQEVPVGVVGELLIGGVQVARGYRRRPGLTAERFVPDPFAAELRGSGERVYRTGDLARRLPDGSIDFLGRIDHQVKLRGFRIELGEVEAALAAHPAVREAVVVARETLGGDRRLVAYVVTAGAEAPQPAELLQAVAKRLPDHMVPSAVVVLDEMPLSPNGKVDRGKLPEPEAERPASATGSVPPRSPAEELVAAMWAERLGREQLGAMDDFFASGGNSLAAAVFINRLQERLGEIVHVVSLFDHPTVEGFARHLEQEYPDALSRLIGSPAGRQAGSVEDAPVGPADVAHLLRLVPPRPLSAAEEEVERVGGLSPSPLFVLAPPRSGTTLLRVMLAGHPGIFAPPELELLRFRTMGERRDAFQGRDAFRLEGLIRAVMEARGCTVDRARAATAELEQRDAGVVEVYQVLQDWIGDRILVDKTPTYAWSRDTLQAAEKLFREPRYIHLVRQPQAVVRSFEEARLQQIFFRHEHPFTRRQLGELLWTVSHENVDQFLGGVARGRWLRVDFEDLVSRPEAELRRIAAFLGVGYHPDMQRPYDGGSRRMTDGLHEESRMIGDVKFHQHSGIDASVAERWRSGPGAPEMGEPTRRVMRRLGLAGGDDASGAPRPALPRELVALRSGGSEAPLFLVHPVAGDVYFYRDLVRAMPEGRPVFGFQAPGLDGREEPLTTVEELAGRYVESLLAFRPAGPYLLAGSSLGGTIAYEMAQRLRVLGREVAFLGMVDTPGVSQLPAPFAGAEAEAMVLAYLAGPIGAERYQALEALAPEERPAFMVAELDRAGRLQEGLGEEVLARLVQVIRSNQAAMIAYRPQPYQGPIAFFRAADGGSRFAEAREEPWRPLVLGGLTVRVVPGDHLSMNLASNAVHLARALQEEIEKSPASARGALAVVAASSPD